MRTFFKTILWLVLALFIGAGAFAWLLRRQSHQLDRIIEQAATAGHVNPKLIAALADFSSNNEPGFASREHYGLLALTTADGKAWAAATGGEFDTFALFDPALNLRIGVWKFATALQSWSHETKPEVWAVAEWKTNRETIRAWADLKSGDEVSRIDDARVRRFVAGVLQQAQR